MFIFRIRMHKKLMVVILIGIVIGRTAGSQENELSDLSARKKIHLDKRGFCKSLKQSAGKYEMRKFESTNDFLRAPY